MSDLNQAEMIARRIVDIVMQADAEVPIRGAWAKVTKVIGGVGQGTVTGGTLMIETSDDKVIPYSKKQQRND